LVEAAVAVIMSALAKEAVMVDMPAVVEAEVAEIPVAEAEMADPVM
jgi:hypothetical protein